MEAHHVGEGQVHELLHDPAPHLADAPARVAAEALEVDGRGRQDLEPGAEGAIHVGRHVGGRLGEDLRHVAEELGAVLLDDLGGEVVLRGEVRVEGARGHSGLADDFGDGGPLVAAALEGAEGGLHDPAALDLLRDGGSAARSFDGCAHRRTKIQRGRSGSLRGLAAPG